MSDQAAQAFRELIAHHAELQGSIRAACLRDEEMDLVALGQELGFSFTRREYLTLWVRLAARGKLNDFEIELNAKIKHYLDGGSFAWMHQGLAENSPSVAPRDVAVNPDALGIAVITAPRTPTTLEATLVSLRQGGFDQTIHVFAEPESLLAGWSDPGVRLHQNRERLGLYPNWLNAARWLLDNTDKPYLLLCEDDVEFCATAAAGLFHGLTSLDRIGYVSLYTPVRAIEMANVPLQPGWAALTLGRLNWGALAYAFPRRVLAEIVHRDQTPARESTDSHVAEHIRCLDLICWHHLPSLARHTGDCNSSVGHPARRGYEALGYDPNYAGFRDEFVKTQPPSSDHIVPQIPAELPGELWGMVAYFNPAGYANKLKNLTKCARGVRTQGLKLLIVELAFGAAPFEVQEQLCDCLVQRRSNCVLWHKERLLNIGLRHLPATCDKVVWLDGDLLFENAAWVAETSRFLQSYVALQPFDTACWLPQDTEWTPPESFKFGSKERQKLSGMGYALSRIRDRGDILIDYYRHGHTGFAWAARRHVLEQHGFFDLQILGGGDFVMAHAMYGHEEFWNGVLPGLYPLSPRLQGQMARWSRLFYEDVRGSVWYVPGRVLHLWHGNQTDRKYTDRHRLLQDWDFDPQEDLTLDSNGCWSWASNKPALHEAVTQYFSARKEQ